MVFMGDVFRLAEDSIGTAPEQEGVYALYQGNELIYIGKAEQGGSIKSSLQNHLSGVDPCTRTATAYRYEICDNPRHREELYLQVYAVSYLKLPRCNVRTG
jgi:hypothetical protein